MRKFSLISLAMLIVSLPTIAGGLLTNTNQNATFLRNPARGAVIAIDGVYSNPAGIAFLPEGFHLSLSWQAAWQKRQITTNLGTEKLYEGSTAAPVIPSFQAAYVFNDKWSLSAQFAIGGGGGKGKTLGHSTPHRGSTHKQQHKKSLHRSLIVLSC